MADLSLLQSVSYIAGALGVCVAAFYYAVNIREQTRNRRSTLVNNQLNSLKSKEGYRDYYELMSMQWTDFDDFKRKYDSTVNPENWIKRAAWWGVCDYVGWQLMNGLVDLSTVHYSGGGNMRLMWHKFKPVIEEYRKHEYGMVTYNNWEYLADELDKFVSTEDKIRQEWMKEHTFKHEDTRATNPQ